MTEVCTFDVYEGNLVNVTFRSNVMVTVENFQSDFIFKLQGMIDACAPFTLFVDTVQIQNVPMSVSYSVIKFMRSNRETIRSYMLASAIIIESELVRNLLAGVFAVVPPVSPNMLTDDHAAGLQFIESRMPQ